MKSILVALTLLLAPGLAASAGPLACPDLAGAVQVGGCPTDAELQYTFTGYCSDNARMYDKSDPVCNSFESYRRLKNVALWESADGHFHGYLSCDLAENTIKAARASAVAVSRKGNLTRVICSYPDNITLVHRSRQNCTVEGDGNCAANPAACKARCD